MYYLQKKLNQYNEFNRTPKSNGYFAINQPITEDGVIGPETKSAIYDFEQNNPYIIETGEIERTQNIEKTISLLPSSITPVSTINNIENISEDSKPADLKFPSHSSSHIALSKTTIVKPINEIAIIIMTIIFFLNIITCIN